MRLSWGRDAPFAARQIEQYDLDPILGQVAPEQIIIGERFMVCPEFRGSDVLYKMFCAYLNFVNENRIQLIFGDCEPHLLNVYQGLGFRRYTKRNVTSTEAGYLIPLLMVAEDIEYMKAIGSPLVKILRNFGSDSRVPACVETLLSKESAVLSQRLSPKEEYWREVFGALSVLRGNWVSPFDGLSQTQVDRCLEKSSAIACRRGD